MKENILLSFKIFSFSLKNTTTKIISEISNNKIKKKDNNRKFFNIWHHVIKDIEIFCKRYQAICIYCKYK